MSSAPIADNTPFIELPNETPIVEETGFSTNLTTVRENRTPALEAALEQVQQNAIEDVKSTFLILDLKSLSLKKLKKMDSALVTAHAKNEKAIKTIQFDSSRKIVVIEKDGKFRLYKIGNGGAGALFSDKSFSKVEKFINENYPAQVNLKTISLEDLKKMDSELTKAHAKNEDAIKSIQTANSFVIVEKDGKFRLYKIGNGGASALFSSIELSKVKDYINKM